MSQEVNEQYIDLLIKQATEGLDEHEEAQLGQLAAGSAAGDDQGFEMAAAAVSMIGLDTSEAMPAHLRSSIASAADQYFSANPTQPFEKSPIAAADDEYQKTFAFDPPRRNWSWLGWVVAAAACIALAVNIGVTRLNRTEIGTSHPTPSPATLTPEQQMDAMLASAEPMIKAKWAPGTMPDIKDVSGEVVWSDRMQKGYMRLHGLPMNDVSKTTYQLWIFDKTQSPKTPIDGGTFDVDRNGDIVIPINAKLKAQGPSMFAITMEKPGGVVVSDRGKLAALAKVETQQGA